MGHIVQRRHLAPFRHLAKPFLAPGIRIRELQVPSFPTLVEIPFHPVALSFSRHEVLRPLLSFQPYIRTQGQHIPSRLVESRELQLSAFQKMFPSHLIMLRRTGLEPVNAGHPEIGRQGKTVKTEEMIELLHLREIHIQQVLLRREIFHRQPGLDAVIRTAVLRIIARNTDLFPI